MTANLPRSRSAFATIRRHAGRLLVGLAAATLAFGCTRQQLTNDVEPITPALGAKLDQQIQPLLDAHGVITAGIGVINNGRVSWTRYYGEQSPGVPASADTLFNVASMTKSVAAETVLRLVADGRLSLDESMAPWWVDPDLVDDPRHPSLTPRMALTHTTGFPNWRFFTADRVLRLQRDPGTAYGYSGEGFEYLARYAENKLGQDFGQLAREQVFEPLGIERASLSVRESSFAHMAQTRTERGDFPGHYCRPNGWCRSPGDISTADDMVISVEDYARFMISAWRGDGLDDALLAERNQVHTSLDGHPNESVACEPGTPEDCPQQQGYGLGWKVLDYGDNKLIGHGGSDWSEVSLGYFHSRSGDGVVVFLNVPMVPGLKAMAEILALLDPDSPMVEEYRRRYAQANGD